ncbi:hypothetical protein [Rhizobium rhizogenes]|uniref:hypothetical protein n=1 Tax=Rhizobium rhizogenes TaxID=359 RepID=UPI00122F8999|nr:hypothetical protein [Rhizobium rhizogenes]
MTDIVERLNLDHSTLNPLHKEAADEITRLRQLLSESQKREKEARAKALEEAAAYHDDLAAQHAASHEHVVSEHHEMMERQHTRFAASIRALQSEER